MNSDQCTSIFNQTNTAQARRIENIRFLHERKEEEKKKAAELK